MNEYVSEIEKKILDSQVPIQTKSEDITTVNDEKGIWLNKDECLDWSGPINLNEYPINKDDSPIIINKHNNGKIEQNQEVLIRYLRPPTPEPEEIIIREEPCVQEHPAPPLIIRQEGIRPNTPEPIVYREHPPEPPKKVEKKIITIPAKKVGPPPRKVVVEKLPDMPSKPPDIIIEKWLPYPNRKRKIVYEKCCFPIQAELKNELIEWQSPLVKIEPIIHDLGIYKVDPEVYKMNYEFSNMKKYEQFKSEIDSDHFIDFDYLEELGIDEMFSNKNFCCQTEYQSENIYEFFPYGNNIHTLSRQEEYNNSNQKINQQSFDSLYEQLNDSFIKNTEQEILVYHEKKSDEIKWVKYSDVRNEIYELGSGLMSLGFGSDQDAKIGFYMSDRPECTLLDLCCGLFSFIRVPINKKKSIAEISKILNQSKLSVVMCDNSYMAIDLMQNVSNLKLIIIFEREIEQCAVDKAKTLNIHLINFEKIKEIGRNNPKNPKFENNLHSIYYKNNEITFDAALTNSSIANANTLVENKLKESSIFLVPSKEVYFSGQSSWNVLNTVIQILILRNNGSIAFSPSNNESILQKLIKLRPTVTYLNNTQIRNLFDELKLDKNREQSQIRLKLIFTDSIVFDREIIKFFENIGCKIIEITCELENWSGNSNCKFMLPAELICPHIWLSPLFMQEIKFSIKDDEKLKHFDIKSLNSLENIYLKGNLVHQIFIFCDKNGDLVGIVVPNKTHIQQLADAYNLNYDFTRLCKNPTLNEIILTQMNNIAHENNLVKNAKVKSIYLYHQLIRDRQEAQNLFNQME